MATKRICGFECGVGASNSHITLGTHSAFNTSIFRSGGTFGRSVRVNLAAQNTAVTFNNIGVTSTVVIRLYVRFETLPNANTLILHNTEAGSGIFLGLGFKASDGKIYTAVSNAGVITFGATGVTVETGRWYMLELRIVDNATNYVIDGRVGDDEGNITALAQLTRVILTSMNNTPAFGSTANVTADMYFDDVKIATASADYPLGEGSSLPFIPVSDGSHNISGANQFERGTTGVDITNATTTAYQLVDELPLDSSFPTADDFVAAIAPASANDYVEVKFGPAPGVSAPVDPPNAVEFIVGFHHGLATASNLRLAVNDNGTTDNVYNASAIGGGTVDYAAKHYSDPPSAASAWHINGDGSDGDFLDIRMRFYSSDADPDVYWDCALIEADFPATVPPPPPGGYYACAGTLPTFQTADQDKIDELRELYADGDPIGQVFELVKVSWPAPDGDIYYAVQQTDEVATVAPPVSPIETRIIPDSNPDWFLPVQMDSTVGDEEVDLEFWDGDGVISDLLVDHGEGIKVELFYWFPLVELLLPIWHGHLRQEDEAEIDVCRIKAVQGFRSADALLPRRAHYRECQAIFGGVFDTQEEIDELTDCTYNRQVPGGMVGNLDGAVPYTSCPRRNRQDCIDRLGNNANFMLSHATVSVTIQNGQTKGPMLYSTSNGNETNLKDSVPVVMGTHRVNNMPVLVGRKDFNNNNPDDAFYVALYEACEGPVESISNIRVTVKGETKDPADPFYIRTRVGTVGQTPADTALTPHSYSSTALIRYTFGWLNPAEMGDADASASAVIVGLNDIRIYTDEDTYTEEWTDNRAWHIMKMLTDKRWGFGYDYARLDIPSFIEAACWCANVVQFVDPNGDEFDHIRALSHVQLNGRKVQQQIEDMCMAGRLSRPFLFNGKIHIVPLRQMTDIELAAAPVFTDEGSAPNIIHDEIAENVFKTTLKRTRISDLDLPNRVECTINDAEDDYAERPLRPVEDIDAQLRAGRVVGDYSKKQNIKKYPLAGVVVEDQGFKVAWSLLDVGPFDEGGLANNLELKFNIWFMEALDLYPSRVIKVESSQITRYGFDYFRVKNIKRLSNLHVELTVQAYNEDWYETFETLFGSIDPIPTDPEPPTTGTVAGPVDPLVFGDVTYSGGILTINAAATP
jgi:hypothetical protein